jgi:phosphomannomutase
MWRDDELIYNNKFTPPESLIEHLEEKIKYSKYYHRAGNHIEDRGSMLNFSVVGRNCTQEQREDYFKWDKQTNERKNISNDIKSTWTKLDAVIGGQISIDIYPKGSDKSQVLNIIEQERLVPPSEYIFIGDGIENGGNDYPLAELMDNTEICDWYHTKGWEHTKEILESLID